MIVSQLPRLLGVTVRADDTLRRAIEIVGDLDQTSLQTFVVGALCLGLVTVASAWRLGAPAALVAVVGATVAVAIFPSTLGTVQVIGELPGGIPPLHVPSGTSADVWALLPISAVIALLAAADTIVSSRAFAQRNGYDVDANRDLIGLGSANLASGLSGGITTSASAARTAVVEMVGGRSQLASVAAAGAMVIVLVFLTRPLETVPTAALAAVVIGAVLRLVEVRSLRALWRIRRSEFLIALTTAFGAVVFGLLEGIVIGVALTLVDFGVRRVWRRRYSPGLRDERRAGALAPAVGSPPAPVYRFTGALYFANALRFRDGALRLIEGTPRAQRLIVDATAIPDVDATAVQMLADLVDGLQRRGVALVLVGLAPSVRQVLSKAGMLDRIVLDHVSDTSEGSSPVGPVGVSERSGPVVRLNAGPSPPPPEDPSRTVQLRRSASMDIHSDEGRIRRILVGVDGSEGAERAVHWQARLARQTGADVVAAHALSTPVFCRRVRIRDRNRLRRLGARLERVAISRNEP